MGKNKCKKLSKSAVQYRKVRNSDAKNITSEDITKTDIFGLRLDLIICLLLSIITVVVYWQVTHQSFLNFDDSLYVTDNSHVKSGLTLKSITWSFSFKDKEGTYWHPLTWLSHILDCQIYGLDPGGHHLTNLIFHVLNAILLFLVFKRMSGSIWSSAFISALFALHPINVESVAWVAERKNILSTFFWMLTLLSYSFYAARPAVYRYLPVLFFFVLGLLAKPMLVTLPFVLLLLDYWPLGRLRQTVVQDVSRLVAEKIPLFFVSAVSIYLSISSLAGYGGDVKSLELVPMLLRVSNALVSYVTYIGKMVWPQNLAIHYPYPNAIPFWKVVCSTLFLIFASLLVVVVSKRRPYLLVGWFWFLGTLVPVSGVVQTGLWPAMADRWAYIPFIGLFIMIAWGVPELLERWRYKKRALAILGVSVIFILTTMTFLQLRYWKNNIVLYEHALRVTTNNAFIHNSLGNALEKQGKNNEAISHFAEALQINPEYPDANYNMGYVYLKMGNVVEAIKYLSKTLQINPYYYKAHSNLGAAFLKQGKISEAITHFSEAVRIKPDYAIGHNNLGVVLLKNGNIPEAIRHLTEAVKIKPDYIKALNNLRDAREKQAEIEKGNRH